MILAAVVAVLVSILPAELMRRRDLERRADVSTGPMMPLVRAVMARAVRASDVRALYLFAIASLVRSRRHAVHLGTYAGLAVAAALVGVATSSIRGSLTLATPQVALLALPLVFMFFAILGLRSACAIPVDLEANWPLRLRQPTVQASLNAMRLVLLTLAVLPPVALAALASAWLWGARTGGLVAMWDLTAGMLLIELALGSWNKVPFATTHEPAVDSLRSKWPWLAVALYFYGFHLAIVEVWCLAIARRAGRARGHWRRMPGHRAAAHEAPAAGSRGDVRGQPRHLRNAEALPRARLSLSRARGRRPGFGRQGDAAQLAGVQPIQPAVLARVHHDVAGPAIEVRRHHLAAARADEQPVARLLPPRGQHVERLAFEEPHHGHDRDKRRHRHQRAVTTQADLHRLASGQRIE